MCTGVTKGRDAETQNSLLQHHYPIVKRLRKCQIIKSLQNQKDNKPCTVSIRPKTENPEHIV